MTGFAVTDLKTIIEHMPREAARCKADWRRLLGAAYSALEPSLEKVAGRVTGKYPHKTGNYMYEVRRQGDGWLGVPPDRVAESEDSPWPRLCLDDVQLWRLGAAGWDTAAKLAGCGDKAGDEAHDEVYGNFTLIKVGRRKIDLAKKYKARAFLRFVNGYLKGKDKKFYVEELRAKFNQQFGAGLTKKQWTSERFREDLFKGIGNEDFDALFETMDQASGIYRLKI